ncbi:MAG: hypothetical protein F4Y26_19380, partial [Gammaproteobacteria bacterium]|nr:hypothetical protein [Gammaproteobacteria bacterium]
MRIDVDFDSAIGPDSNGDTPNKATTTPNLRMIFGTTEHTTTDCFRLWRNGAYNALRCRYTVQAGDRDMDGISFPANALSLPSGAELYAKGDPMTPAVLAFGAVSDIAEGKVNAGSTLSVADAEVNEAAGAELVFAVTLSPARLEAATVDYATSNDTARAGEDYNAASGTLTFAAGETAKTVSVTVLDDLLDEGREYLTLTLSNPSAGVELEDATARGTIVNTDPMPNAWLSRFGRAASSHAAEAIAERLRGGTQVSETQFALGGRRLDGLFGTEGAEGAESADGDREGGPGGAAAASGAFTPAEERMARMRRELPAGRGFGAGAGTGFTGGGFGAGGSASAAGSGPPAGSTFAASGRGGASGRVAGGGPGAAWAALLSRLDGGGTRAGRGLVEGLRLADGLRGTDWRELIANGSFDYAAPAADGADGAARTSGRGRGGGAAVSGPPRPPDGGGGPGCGPSPPPGGGRGGGRAAGGGRGPGGADALRRHRRPADGRRRRGDRPCGGGHTAGPLHVRRDALAKLRRGPLRRGGRRRRGRKRADERQSLRRLRAERACQRLGYARLRRGPCRPLPGVFRRRRRDAADERDGGVRRPGPPEPTRRRRRTCRGG